MNAKTGFWRQLLAALRRDTPAFKPEQPRSPIELYEASGGDLANANERTRALLEEAERNHRRQAQKPGNAAASPDEAVLRMLGGATFGPSASLTLPSGQTLSADEAQAFNSLYADDETDPRGR